MMHLDRYPDSIVKEIKRFAPVSKNWAYAACITHDDVRQEIALAVLAGFDPQRVVPAALRIRKIQGVWRSEDATCMACEFDPEAHDGANRVERIDPLIDADGIDDLMRRYGIGRRAAQIRVKKQWLVMESQGDLFSWGENGRR